MWEISFNDDGSIGIIEVMDTSFANIAKHTAEWLYYSAIRQDLLSVDVKEIGARAKKLAYTELVDKACWPSLNGECYAHLVTEALDHHELTLVGLKPGMRMRLANKKATEEDIKHLLTECYLKAKDGSRYAILDTYEGIYAVDLQITGIALNIIEMSKPL